MTPTIIILNAALIALVVGVIVGMHFWAIKTSPSDEQMLRFARERHDLHARRERGRSRATARPVFDR